MGAGDVTNIYCPTTFRCDNLPCKEQRFADGVAYFLHSVMMGRVHDSRYRKGMGAAGERKARPSY